MSLLVASQLNKAYGALDVLLGVNARIEAGDRIGFVGANGSGKTTLLRILAGEEPPTTGALHRKRGLSVGYLPQDPPPPGDLTVHESMLEVFAALRAQGAALAEQAHALALAAQRGAADYDALLGSYGHAEEAFAVAGGYSYETRIAQVLGGLGFNPEDHDKPLAHLSGGERTRALLAQLLLQETDLLLLDEPTNHLDLEAVEWLEETLVHWQGAILVVAHDRYFLDRIATRIWEMDACQVVPYRGNYTQFQSVRAARRERQRREWEEQQEFVAKTEDFIRKNLAGQRTREAQGRRTRLERFLRDEAIDRPQEAQSIRLGLTTQIRSGDLVLATKDLLVGYEEPLFACPDLEIRRGNRVALIGPNGAGKTTLLKTILGQLRPLAGRVRLGASVQIGYLAQAQAGLDPSQTVIDEVMDAGELTTAEARNFLGQFLFSGDDVFRTVGTLSGGQRSRVALARLTLQGANLLLLDEPTNHLDLDSQEILQDVLAGFPGTVLLVSHDRYLVQELATHVWHVAGDRLTVYEGNYSEFLRQRTVTAGDSNNDAEPRSPTEEDRERSRAERRQRKAAEKLAEEAEALEHAVHALEQQMDRLGADLEAASLRGDLSEIQRLGKAYQDMDAQLHRALATWAERAEAAARSRDELVPDRV